MINEEDKQKNVRKRTPAQWKQFEAAEARNRAIANGEIKEGDELDVQNGKLGHETDKLGEKGGK